MADATSPQARPVFPAAQDLVEKPGLPLRRYAEWTMIYGALFLFAVLVGAPFVYMISGSLKTNGELFNYPINFGVINPTLDNYSRLLSGTEIPYIQQFINSLIIAISQTFLSLLISSMVGWGFAKYDFGWRIYCYLTRGANFRGGT